MDKLLTPDDVAAISPAGEAYDGSPGVGIPVGSAQAGEGRDDVYAAGIRHL